MNDIGILQGRVCPPRLDSFQLFPQGRWEEELRRVRELGFSALELLYDRALLCDQLLSSGMFLDAVGQIPGLNVNSICLDYLASFSALEEPDRFKDRLDRLMGLLNNSLISVLILPFLEDNNLTSAQDFDAALSHLAAAGIDDRLQDRQMCLALELSLPAHTIKEVWRNYRFKHIKICYDLGNARSMGFLPEEEVLTLNGLIGHVHVKDRRVNGPNVMLGEGDVDFRACLKALKTIAYSGPLILETQYAVSPETEAAQNLAFIRDCCEALV